MYERFYSFPTLHNCIYINQNGFRKKHSTDHVLISLTNQMKSNQIYFYHTYESTLLKKIDQQKIENRQFTIKYD